MPIITSHSRKDTRAIQEQVRYVRRFENEAQISITLLHNITSKHLDTDEIIQAFKENDKYRRKRKNGIVLYHDIISFHPKSRTYLLKHQFILEDFATKYINKRAKNSLALMQVHTDKDHLHMHILISPNEKYTSKSTRISKSKFTQIRRELEAYQLERFPELEHSYIHQSNQQNKIEKERQDKDFPEQKSLFDY